VSSWCIVPVKGAFHPFAIPPPRRLCHIPAVHRTENIFRFQDGQPLGSRPDEVALEEPLEIRVEGEPLAVAMRTPGHDRELAAGWLLSEGLITRADDLADIVARPGEDPRAAMVDVMLRTPAAFDAAKHRRAALSNASCGLCGAASVAQVLRQFPKIDSAFLISASLLPLLPQRLMESQPAFQRTGGLHACGLFDAGGALVALREDVGRHNALDKLLGWALLEGRLPLKECLLLLSGRVSFEMMQKALAAGIPIVAAIGAPSSLAVEVAKESGQTLVAFLRGGGFNVYAGPKKIRGAGA
jgi:FdhD protein